jgi:outer membrane immunogenic protein
MKKLATAIAAIALIGTPAFAADMAVKAPPPMPAPVYNWTGFYVGVNAGARFGSVKTDFNVAPSTIFLNASNGPQGATIPGFAGSDRTYPDGFMGGGQIGYNWQVSPIWVVGLEADFQGAVERDHSTLTSNFSAPLFFLPPFSGPSGATAAGTTALDYQTKIEWFGTVRGRIGYVWGNGSVMSYLTGGLAYGKVDLEGTGTVSGVLETIPFPLLSVTQAFGHSQVNTGWVVGYGTEGKLLIPGWTYKIEGLYMDLGHLDATGPGGTATITSGTLPSGFISTTTAGPVTTHSHFTDGILRAGLNYHF